MKEMCMEMLDEMLDEQGDVMVAGISFAPSYILKQLDPIAYKQALDEVVESRIDDLRDEVDSLDPELDAEEIALLVADIEALENI